MGFEAAEPVLDVSLFIEEGTVWSWGGLRKLRSMSGHWEFKAEPGERGGEGGGWLSIE